MSHQDEFEYLKAQAIALAEHKTCNSGEDYMHYHAFPYGHCILLDYYEKPHYTSAPRVPNINECRSFLRRSSSKCPPLPSERRG